MRAKAGCGILYGWLLLDDAALAVGDEVSEVGNVFTEFAGGDFFAHGSEGVSGVELAGLQETVGVAELPDLLRGEAAALQSYFVEAVGAVVALGGGEGVGHDVLGGHGAAADVGVAADATELVDRAEGSDDGEVFDDDVAGEGGGVGEDAVAADVRVVTDVGAGHQETVVAEGG
jgi:hypothetical protein